MMRELYRDPVYDGATDPRVVIDRSGEWWMFYTQRRATHPDPGPEVAWVHGTRVGVARSGDGLSWHYLGRLEPASGGLLLTPGAPADRVDSTHWAPEVVHDGQRWRMYLTEIEGVPDRWPGHARRIVEYVSDDLIRWRRRGALALPGDRAIDATVARCPDGRWRLWYKDEAADSVTTVAVSDDLDRWRVEAVAIGGRPHEGPDVFELGGHWWMIVDEWRGMGVYRSADATTWTRQGGADAVVLGAGEVPGGGFGHHGAAVIDGDDAWYFFFAHPDGGRRSVVLRARLSVTAGILRVG